MPTHPFLSPEWIDAAREIRARRAGNPIDQPGFVVNATITDVPFGEGRIEVHSEHGPVIGWEPGHQDGAELSFTVDYSLARQLVIEDDLDVLAQASASGALRMDGDVAHLRSWWATRVANPDAVALDDELRAMTA
jgi:hypothetical protein